MSALCADEFRRDQQWEAIRRDPELLEAVMAANRPKLMGAIAITEQALKTQPIRLAVMAGLLRLNTETVETQK